MKIIIEKSPIFEIIQVSIATPHSVRKKGVNEYPFGMEIKERTWSDSSYSYRFGFNGQERDDEVKGDGNSLDFGARIYDSRLGRWMSVDPLWNFYPEMSDYSFALNSPIVFVDKVGKYVVVAIRRESESEGREPMFRIINSAFNGKVIASVANERKGYIQIQIKDGEILTEQERATFKLLNDMMTNSETLYTIYAGETWQRGYNSQDDYFDKTIYEASMMETPLYTEDGLNPFNQLYCLYHFFAEQKLKEENPNSKFVFGREYVTPKAKILKDKQCAATTSEQNKVFGYSTDVSTIVKTGDTYSVGFVNSKGNLIGTLKSNTLNGEYSYEKNDRIDKNGDTLPSGPLKEDGTF